MIISASRRCDIPCHYGEWLIKRLCAGYVIVRNPYNRKTRLIELTPDAVDCIVFWTKDAANLLPRLDELDRRGYKYYFQFTLTPYGRDIERNLRPKDEIIDTFIELSRMLGRERVVWRYDPIIVDGARTVDWHKEKFAAMCERLAPHCERVVISYVDLYRGMKRTGITEVSESDKAALTPYIARAARERGLDIVACCESGLSEYGVGQSSCIDGALIERIVGRRLGLSPDKNQRPGCGCVASVDIGSYDCCPNGCVYCYANRSAEVAARNYAAHDAGGECLM